MTNGDEAPQRNCDSLKISKHHLSANLRCQESIEGVSQLFHHLLVLVQLLQVLTSWDGSSMSSRSGDSGGVPLRALWPYQYSSRWLWPSMAIYGLWLRMPPNRGISDFVCVFSCFFMFFLPNLGTNRTSKVNPSSTLLKGTLARCACLGSLAEKSDSTLGENLQKGDDITMVWVETHCWAFYTWVCLKIVYP